MRILQLCNKPPFPPIDGGSKAMANIATGLLKAGHEVTVLCIATSKHPLLLKDIPKDLQERTNIQGVFVDTSLNVVDAFTDLITADNYNISRFFSPDMDILLIRTLSQQRFDIVHLESLFMTPYIPTIRRYTKAPIVLRSHNLEHVIQERIAQGERNFLKRPYRKFLAKQLHDHEMAALQRVDGVAAISPSDEAKFAAIGSGTPIVTIPFSVDPEEYRTEEKAFTTPSFFHLGSMDWLPNEEAIRWLLNSVWPRVIKKRPKARLHLAGNKMPDDLLAMELPGATIRGRVRSASGFMSKHQVMLVPLFSAGGMRVKIIEGMAMGKAIIATPIGAEGIAHTDGKNILLASTATQFVDQIIALHDEPERIRTMGRNAQDLVREKYSNDRTVADLIAFYSGLLRA